MKEATSIKAITSSLCMCHVHVYYVCDGMCGNEWCNGGVEEVVVVAGVNEV